MSKGIEKENGRLNFHFVWERGIASLLLRHPVQKPVRIYLRDATSTPWVPAYLTLGAYEGESASFLFLPFLTWLPTGRRDAGLCSPSLASPPGLHRRRRHLANVSWIVLELAARKRRYALYRHSLREIWSSSKSVRCTLPTLKYCEFLAKKNVLKLLWLPNMHLR